MTHLLAILGLVVSANLDTLVVGLAYGCRKMHLSFLSNFICALLPSIGTFVMMLLGETAKNIVPAPAAGILGAGILMAAGFFMIAQSFRRQRPARPGKNTTRLLDAGACRGSASRDEARSGRILDDPVRVDYDDSGSIDTGEAAVLALALMLNNLPCGFGAGLMGLNIILAPCITFVTCLAFLAAGIKAGHHYVSAWSGENCDLAAGLLLILIAAYEIVS